MEKTKIEWATHTFNPWIGCAKCGPGCENCYACTLMATRYGRVTWGATGTRKKTSPANWRNPLRWHEDAAFGIEPVRVFSASLADVFEDYHGDGATPDRPASLDPWRHELFDLIEQTWRLDWLLLTKRPAIAQRFLRRRLPGNVWIGTSIENQKTADRRIPILADIPAAVRFLSCEPLLGPIDLRPHLSRIDWVIVGGESGAGARPMDPDWVRNICLQCAAAGVPFFFKQWGGRYPKEHGRLLDTLTWDEFPTPRTINSAVRSHHGR